MIKTVGLTKKFGKDRGVFDVNLEVEQGTIYGFVGPNGAGKTTTIKILCGLLAPDQGKATIADLEVTPRNLARIKRTIGYMPDITGVYEQMSVWEFLDFYGAAFKIPPKPRKARIEEVLAITKAEEMIDFQMTSLSRGMRQRIGLAKTLMHDPAILILDEPAGGLDPNARIEMRQTIGRLKSLGKTILLSSHILPELSSVCDRVGIIFKGQLLAQGSVQEITSRLQENLVIEVTVDHDAPRALELLRQIEGVESVTAMDAYQLQFIYSGSRGQVSAILAHLMAEGLSVRWFSENEADLENVFLRITRGERSMEG